MHINQQTKKQLHVSLGDSMSLLRNLSFRKRGRQSSSFQQERLLTACGQRPAVTKRTTCEKKKKNILFICLSKKTERLLPRGFTLTMDDISSCSDDEYGPLASTWGDQAKDTNADVIEAWRSLADPNAKLGPKGLGSGGLHRRGKNYKPVDEEVILKQREKTAAMRPKPKSKSGSHRREGGGGASEKKTSRSKGGNIHKKEHSQQQQPNHWNPFRSTSKPLPDSQPAWLKETASSYFRSREKSVDDSQYRVPASWGITPLPPPPPPSQQAPSSSLASPNKPSSVRFSEPITTSMTSPPPSPPSSASTANTPTFELPSRRPPPKGGKFVWLDQPLSNQPFWEQPNVTNSVSLVSLFFSLPHKYRVT